MVTTIYFSLAHYNWKRLSSQSVYDEFCEFKLISYDCQYFCQHSLTLGTVTDPFNTFVKIPLTLGTATDAWSTF